MIPQTFVDIDYLLNYTGLKLLQLLKDLLNSFVVPNNFTVSGDCISSLYPSFVLNTSFLLILLMQTYIGGIVFNVSCFLMMHSFHVGAIILFFIVFILFSSISHA